MSDRKYRQRGYDDSGRDREQRPRGPQKPPERKEGPRGRGLGAPTETVFRCPSCNALALAPDAEQFDAACPKCAAAYHACIACSNFDPHATYECRLSIPERVPRKRDANRCPLFLAKTTVEFARGGEMLDPSEARAAFEKLFDF